MDEARQVRDFWFGKVPLSPATLEERLGLWFGEHQEESLTQRDEMIRARFGNLVERAAHGVLDSWADSPRRCLSLIIVLDQFPRHLYRGTARAFAYDDKALGLTLSGMRSAADGALDVVERIFFYMPLQHSEAREVQEESVAAYRQLLHEVPDELRSKFERTLEWAEHHRDIIERFTRFPHRNAALGRASTREEILWLKSEGDRMGQ